MAIREKDKSLLEIAIELVSKKRKPCKLNTIITEVMEIKGYKGAKAKDHTAQFILDFMQSGYFVYCGEDEWDLKERQSTTVLDKDGGDYESTSSGYEEAKKNELKEENLYEKDYNDNNDDLDDDSDEDEEDDDIERELKEYEDDDLSSEFETDEYDEEDDEEE